MPLAVAVLAAGLLIGGTGGAIAVGTIGTNDIRNGAVTTPKLHINAVTSPKIQKAPSESGPQGGSGAHVEHIIKKLEGTIGERNTYGHDPRNVPG
jgi:hypothetical protein